MPNPTPDSIWMRFLTDSEEAIARSAPREPSALERARHPEARTYVGDAWSPADTLPEPAWRHLDTRGRIRRLGRILTGAAALAALLGLFTCLPEEPPSLPGGPAETGTPQKTSAVVESPSPAHPFPQSTDAT